jgi:hypothetical protein
MIFDAAGGGVQADPRGRERMMLRGWMLRGWVRSGGPQRTPAPVHGVVHVMRPGWPRHRSAGPALGRALPADEPPVPGLRELAPVVHEEAA